MVLQKSTISTVDRQSLTPENTPDGQCLIGGKKEPNPINRFLLEVAFSVIIAIGRPLATWFSGHDGRHLKRRQIEICNG